MKLAVMVMVAVLMIINVVAQAVQTAQKESAAHPEQRVVTQEMDVVLTHPLVVKALMDPMVALSAVLKKMIAAKHRTVVTCVLVISLTPHSLPVDPTTVTLSVNVFEERNKSILISFILVIVNVVVQMRVM